MRERELAGDMFFAKILRGSIFLQKPQILVAVFSSVILFLTAIASFVYSIVDGSNHYAGFVVTTCWCCFVQFLVRKKATVKQRWLRKRRVHESIAGALGMIVIACLVFNNPF